MTHLLGIINSQRIKLKFDFNFWFKKELHDINLLCEEVMFLNVSMNRKQLYYFYLVQQESGDFNTMFDRLFFVSSFLFKTLLSLFNLRTTSP